MIVVLAFVVGLFFMLLYYRLFHTSKISSAFQRSSDPTENGSSGTNGQNRNGKSQNISEKVCEVHVQPGPSMMSLVCSDPSKMVCSDPPRMVCSDPFYILEGSLQTKDVIDGPSCM